MRFPVKMGTKWERIYVWRWLPNVRPTTAEALSGGIGTKKASENQMISEALGIENFSYSGKTGNN